MSVITKNHNSDHQDDWQHDSWIDGDQRSAILSFLMVGSFWPKCELNLIQRITKVKVFTPWYFYFLWKITFTLVSFSKQCGAATDLIPPWRCGGACEDKWLVPWLGLLPEHRNECSALRLVPEAVSFSSNCFPSSSGKMSRSVQSSELNFKTLSKVKLWIGIFLTGNRKFTDLKAFCVKEHFGVTMWWYYANRKVTCNSVTVCPLSGKKRNK